MLYENNLLRLIILVGDLHCLFTLKEIFNMVNFELILSIRNEALFLLGKK